MNTMVVDDRFTVKIVRRGDKYGRNDVLTHDSAEPLVEFWDNKYDQFVSRYYMRTLIDTPQQIGLNLHGGEPEWRVSASGMEEVRNFLRKEA